MSTSENVTSKGGGGQPGSLLHKEEVFAEMDRGHRCVLNLMILMLNLMILMSVTARSCEQIASPGSSGSCEFPLVTHLHCDRCNISCAPP